MGMGFSDVAKEHHPHRAGLRCQHSVTHGDRKKPSGSVVISGRHIPGSVGPLRPSDQYNSLHLLKLGCCGLTEALTTGWAGIEYSSTISSIVMTKAKMSITDVYLNEELHNYRAKQTGCADISKGEDGADDLPSGLFVDSRPPLDLEEARRSLPLGDSSFLCWKKTIMMMMMTMTMQLAGGWLLQHQT
jgi:hypothetical protein